MMHRITFLFLFLSTLTFAQKIYSVGNISWTYQNPKDYFYKTDNFSATIERGKKVLETQENLNLEAEDHILFSAAKSENDPFNIVAGNYLNDENFRKFGAEQYSEELIKIFKKMYTDLNIEADITKEITTIDGKEFYVIISDVKSPKKYKNHLYVGAIADKELQITALFDNDVDEDLILQSIFASKFQE